MPYASIQPFHISASCFIKIVGEVRQSEEWEAVKMNILEIGIEKGIDLGRAETLVKAVELMMKNLGMGLAEACKGMEIRPSTSSHCSLNVYLARSFPKMSSWVINIIMVDGSWR